MKKEEEVKTPAQITASLESQVNNTLKTDQTVDSKDPKNRSMSNKNSQQSSKKSPKKQLDRKLTNQSSLLNMSNSSRKRR